MAEPSFDDIVRALGLGPEHEPWRDRFDDTEGEALTLTHADVRRFLDATGADERAREIILDAVGLLDDPALARLGGHLRRRIVEGLFDPNADWLPVPNLPDAVSPLARVFHALVYIGCVPALRDFHKSRDIPEDISWATMKDVPRQTVIGERIHGIPGMASAWWPMLHFRGFLYEIGRLQYHLHGLTWDEDQLEGVPATTGDHVLGLHIPESGPLDDDACSDSIEQAKAFFTQHFPEVTTTIATCGSWLLDDQLARYLPETSNIVRFQRRFALLETRHESDDGIIEFVFRRPGLDALDSLPGRTSLERAVVSHLRHGGHWYSRSGWFPFELPAP